MSGSEKNMQESIKTVQKSTLKPNFPSPNSFCRSDLCPKQSWAKDLVRPDGLFAMPLHGGWLNGPWVLESSMRYISSDSVFLPHRLIDRNSAEFWRKNPSLAECLTWISWVFGDQVVDCDLDNPGTIEITRPQPQMPWGFLLHWFIRCFTYCSCISDVCHHTHFQVSPGKWCQEERDLQLRYGAAQ